ncbi:MAG: LysR family transcriptional regulator [Pseudomonadota bacterium]
MVDLFSLRAVAMLSETLNFREAAARLNMTQPALSVRLKRLEDLLGVMLFERSRRGVELSPAGRSLLPAIHRVLGEASCLEREAQRVAGGTIGRLRIGYTPISFMAAAPLWIRRFATAFPAVELNLVELLSSEVETALVSGEIDLGFLHPPFEEGGLDALALPSERYVIVLPADDPLSQAASLPFSALADRDLVLPARSVGPHLFARILALCEASGFTPRIRQEVPTSTAVLGLVAAGHGAGIVIGACASLARTDLSFVPIEGPAPELPFALAWRDRPLSPLEQHFIDHIGEEVRQAGRARSRPAAKL